MKQVLGRKGLWVGWLWLAVGCVGCTGSKGDPCQIDADCDKGLVCDPPGVARGTCKNPADIQTKSSGGVGSGTGGLATGGSSSGSGGSDLATGGKQSNSGADAGADASTDAGADAGGDAAAGGA